MALVRLFLLLAHPPRARNTKGPRRTAFTLARNTRATCSTALVQALTCRDRPPTGSAARTETASISCAATPRMSVHAQDIRQAILDRHRACGAFTAPPHEYYTHSARFQDAVYIESTTPTFSRPAHVNRIGRHAHTSRTDLLLAAFAKTMKTTRSAAPSSGPLDSYAPTVCLDAPLRKLVWTFNALAP